VSSALIVFAKAPVAGWAKTRLIPALGAEGAAALAGRLLEHTLAQAVAARCFEAIELCAAPDTGHPALQRAAAAHGAALTAQGEGDLGARMQRALGRALAGHARVLLVGTDAPALDAAALRAAALALAGVDAVFVPALDGGYALVGLSRPAPALFEGIAWSTPTVMAATRERARGAGLRWAELPAVADIDEPADLAHLPAGF
jgi:rSAM/selenodomain-associated transferase 1